MCTGMRCKNALHLSGDAEEDNETNNSKSALSLQRDDMAIESQKIHETILKIYHTS